jgi:hypothetical protein
MTASNFNMGEERGVGCFSLRQGDERGGVELEMRMEERDTHNSKQDKVSKSQQKYDSDKENRIKDRDRRGPIKRQRHKQRQRQR